MAIQYQKQFESLFNVTVTRKIPEDKWVDFFRLMNKYEIDNLNDGTLKHYEKTLRHIHYTAVQMNDYDIIMMTSSLEFNKCGC